MNSRLYSTTLSVFLALTLNSQIPAGYYDSAENLNGYELKTALYDIIKGHTTRTYTDIWGFYSSYELDNYYENDGSILDIYSENPTGSDPYTFTKVSDQCGNYSGEGSCYNREHSFPRSWFGGKINPMNTDIHHIFATDGYVNSIRDSYPYGEVGSANYTSQNGSKRGSARTGLGYTGTVFEPIDEFKGDVARAHFYMAIRYENLISGWENYNEYSDAVLNGTSDQVFEQWVIDMLYEWHINDPVSQKEIDRNNGAYTYQNNRNPFVDHPEFVDSIWFPSGEIPPVDPPSCLKLVFPDSEANPIWYETEFSENSITNYASHAYQIYRLEGDTTIAEFDYSKLYFYEDSAAQPGTGQYLGAIRQDTCSAVYYLPDNGNEVLLYDFEKEAGEYIQAGFLSQFGITSYNVISVDSVELPGGYRKTMLVATGNDTATWIEGIGSDKGLLWPVLPENYHESNLHPISSNSSGRMLVCFYETNSNIYKAWDGNCFYNAPTGLDVNKHKNPQSIFKLFPQPANENLHIQIESTSLKKLSIYNQLGAVVYSMEYPDNELEINVSNFPSGMYFLVGKSENDALINTKKIIIK